jgi:hypothetical protein
MFIVFSGFISALITGFIVTKADSWEDLGLEFELGKEAQLDPIISEETSQAKAEETDNTMTKSMKDDVKYLDL